MFPRPLTGVIPPMITPLCDAETLDVAGTERLVEHILGGGVHGLFILGTTGEAPGLPYKLRRQVISRVCAQMAGRVPVLVGITDTAFAESVALAHHAAAMGADAVVAAPPPYFATNQSELIGYMGRLAAALPLPLILYNMPVHTKVFIEADTVRALADIPGIAGLKDSSGDMTYFHRVSRLLADRPNFTRLVGPEELLAESVLAGGHGGVNGGANLFPRLYVDLFGVAQTGDLPEVRRLHAQVMAVGAELYTMGRSSASILRGLKGALMISGVCAGALAEPFQGFGAEELTELEGRWERVRALLASHSVPVT